MSGRRWMKRHDLNPKRLDVVCCEFLVSKGNLDAILLLAGELRCSTTNEFLSKRG
jgi:hypothetical protein